MNKFARVTMVSLMLGLTSSTFARDIHYFTADRLIIIPESSQPKKNKNIAVTNIIVTKPKATLRNGLPDGETPASLACVYGLTPQVSGCNKDIVTTLPNTGWGAIALVDANYYGDAEKDLKKYSEQFGLPECTKANGCFQQYYATAPDYCNKTNPPAQNGWEDEQALDIEMAHAMAPNAHIFLVEAATSSTDDLLKAEDCASSLVATTGGEVSNSWGGEEKPDDPSRNSHFTTPGIVYLASSGDFGAPARYPSASPNVISAGGTRILRDHQGNLTGEVAWSRDPSVPVGGKSGSSGGPSLYQARPVFQNAIQKIVGTHRGTPDIAFDADPKSGVLVYSTYHGGWFVDGGTSASSPALAGIINSSNQRAASTNAELTFIYQTYLKSYHSHWHDILLGNNGYPAMNGYDFVTGIGSPLGLVA